jgi:hypothetical protein
MAITVGCPRKLSPTGAKARIGQGIVHWETSQTDLVGSHRSTSTHSTNDRSRPRLCENSGDLSAVPILIEISPVLVDQKSADHQRLFFARPFSRDCGVFTQARPKAAVRRLACCRHRWARLLPIESLRRVTLCYSEWCPRAARPRGDPKCRCDPDRRHCGAIAPSVGAPVKWEPS